MDIVNIELAQNFYLFGIHSSSLTLGFLYASIGLGAGFAPALVSYLKIVESPKSIRICIWVGFGFCVLGALILSWSPNVYIYLIANLVRTSGTGLLWVYSNVSLQGLVRADVRGRVFAYDLACLTLGEMLSLGVAGFLIDNNWEARMVALFGALGSLVIFVGWSLYFYFGAEKHHNGLVLMQEFEEDTSSEQELQGVEIDNRGDYL
eukprot:TRINITY_DN8827_c0_g1_i1.p1 TRINITY_DN8827_c0_g1~~TRINITY_DN8827_c0_g1_i1.p1  ORF type:complete len:206 (-),score=22.36 TRINITY_DN8827_c0_g1_i1:182-799(-)